MMILHVYFKRLLLVDLYVYMQVKWVKQGCLQAPMLFSIFLSAMLDEAFRDMGVGWRLHTVQTER